MLEITKIELKSIEYLIKLNKAFYQKLNIYSEKCNDAQIKQLFTKTAQDILDTKQKLMDFLNN